MAGSTLTNQDALLKEAYEEGVNNSLSTFTSLGSRLEEGQKKLTGRRTRLNLRNGRPQGFSFGPSPESIPPVSRSKHTESFIFPTYFYTQIGVDWDLMKQGQDDAYADPFQEEMTAATESVTMSYDRQMQGDGSGRLGQIASGGVNSSAGTAFDFDVDDTDRVAFFEEGMLMEFMTDTTPFNTATKYTNPTQGYYEVASVAVTFGATNTITVTCTSTSLEPASNAPIAGAWAVAYGSQAIDVVSGSINAGNEMTGIEALIDDGDQPMLVNTNPSNFPTANTTQGISASSNHWWQSRTVSGSGKYLSRDDVHTALSHINNHGAGLGAMEARFIITHSHQIDKYLDSLYPQERFANDGQAGKFNAGDDSALRADSGPMIHNLPTVKGRYMTKSIAIIIPTGLRKHTMQPIGFYTDDGNLVRMDPSGRPRNIAILFGYCNLGIKMRNRGAKIESLTTT